MEKLIKICAKTYIFSFCIIIEDYLGMAKHSLLSGRPSYTGIGHSDFIVSCTVQNEQGLDKK